MSDRAEDIPGIFIIKVYVKCMKIIQYVSEAGATSKTSLFNESPCRIKICEMVEWHKFAF